MLTTPILLLTFNRPLFARQVLEQIRKVRPKQLFIACDGPREGNVEDIQKCAATRAMLTMIDWECQVFTWFRNENRGCGRGPAEAITWFFEHVEEGIILEDDCVPDPSFFGFCQTLLTHYRHQTDIYMITGTNSLNTWRSGHSSYIFTLMGGSLGWATWRRAWSDFDYEMKSWKTEVGRQRVRETLKHQSIYHHFTTEFDKIADSVPNDVWDFQWFFARLANNGKTLVSTANLIKNIGFNAEATHSIYENDIRANLKLYEVDTKLKHPSHMVDSLFDWVVYERIINPNPKSLWKKARLKALRLLFTHN